MGGGRMKAGRASGVGAAIISLSLAALVVALVPLASGAEVEQLPNLAALPPFDIRVGQADGDPFELDRPLALRFSVAAANRGTYALELLGTPGSATAATAAQCVRWVSAGCTERREVGEFAWHPEHLHWHLEGYALYELRRVRHGTPDMRPRGLVATGGKVSFCLMDGEQIGDPPAGADPLTRAGIYRTCSGFWQGISPGWADVYEYDLPGQQIPLAGVRDGTYALVVTVNPDGRLLETDRADDVAFTRVEISDGGTKARAL